MVFLMLYNTYLYVVIVSEILVKKTAVIDASNPYYWGAGVYKKIHPGLYFPVFRANTSRGG